MSGPYSLELEGQDTTAEPYMGCDFQKEILKAMVRYHSLKATSTRLSG